MLSDHHQRLQVALEAHKKVHAINEARALLQEAPVPQVTEDGLVQGEAKTAMEDVYQLNDCHPLEAVNIDDMVAKLNQDQVRVFDRIVTHLVHQKRHEDCECVPAQACSHCICSLVGLVEQGSHFSFIPLKLR